MPHSIFYNLLATPKSAFYDFNPDFLRMPPASSIILITLLAITSLTTMLERMENQGLISRVQSETDKRKTLLFLTEKAQALKGEYDSVSDEMGSIYYKGFSEDEITRFEECLDRIRKNLEEWQKS